MKNFTFSADEELIARARAIARARGKTLNTAFREWLVEFTAYEAEAPCFDSLMESLRHVSPGRRITREELNSRQ